MSKLTRDEILNLPAGREMDALVAERVMGWKWSLFGNYKWQMEAPDEKNGQVNMVPHYSTSIAAAWEVVEKMSRTQMRGHVGPSLLHDLHGGEVWRASFCSDFGYSPVGCGNTAPLALCRAALLTTLEAE